MHARRIVTFLMTALLGLMVIESTAAVHGGVHDAYADALPTPIESVP